VGVKAFITDLILPIITQARRCPRCTAELAAS
jgi:hypothetical protein